MKSEKNPPNQTQNIWRVRATICVFFIQKQRNANKISVLILWYIFLLESQKKCFADYKVSNSWIWKFIYLFISYVSFHPFFFFPSSETQQIYCLP